MKDAVSDYVKTCKVQGAEVTPTPTKPISYTQLVQNLKSIGVLDADEEDGQGSNTVPAHLSQEHQKQVMIFSEIKWIFNIISPLR